MRNAWQRYAGRTHRVFRPLIRLNIPDSAYDTAARLRAIHGLRTPDALHVAIARHHGRAHLWTNDDRLLKAVGPLAVHLM
ncbi:MAG: type II toxin-antitoxin system VapC family toxin [Caldilineaceae bacterium]|nr:type II toxin-antitoxin system VapC family toxin [Caldilineaceae bacterium]